MFGVGAPRSDIGAPAAAFGAGGSLTAASIFRGLKLAAGPTLEVLNKLSAPAGQSRTQWGLPVSIEMDREATRIYGSSGYFSPGVWYAGAGIGRSLSNRLGMSMSFSHAWTSQAPTCGN